MTVTIQSTDVTSNSTSARTLAFAAVGDVDCVLEGVSLISTAFGGLVLCGRGVIDCWRPITGGSEGVGLGMPGNGAHDSLINCGRVTCQNLSEIADMRWGNAVFAESTVSRASGSDFESLLLIGSADIDGTGTALADALTGVTTLDADDLML